MRVASLFSPAPATTPFGIVMRRFGLLILIPLAAVLARPFPVAGQEQQAEAAEVRDTNILFPVDLIEARLSAPVLRISDMERARPLDEDRSRSVMLAGADGEPTMRAHWKPVAVGAQGFNNEPRYELAAYRLQKMFLEEEEYVVPPVVLRAMAIEEYRQHRSVPGPTIRGTQSVLFLLSYWIQNLAVDTVDPFDAGLFDRDPVYARHFANMNILTHLINHKDSNHGNVIVSMDATNRRVFSVDNDVAFRSQSSDRGDRWRRLQVDRLPEATIERLRAITREDLEAQLGVVAEFEIRDGYLHPVEFGENLRANRGIRVTDDRVQFGLNTAEIREVERAIGRLLRQVERGRITTF